MTPLASYEHTEHACKNVEGEVSHSVAFWCNQELRAGRCTKVLLRQHGVWLSSKLLCVGQHTPKEEEGTIQYLHKSIPEMFVVIVRHCMLI